MRGMDRQGEGGKKSTHLAIREHDGLIDAPDVLLVGFALPGIDRDAGLGNGSGGVVLGAEDIAG